MPAITKPNQHFDATTYTGNGTGQSIVNSGGMQPDLVWLKSRSAAYNHGLIDSVRGINKHLFSNLTNADATCSAGKGITAFNSNGFTLGTESDTSAPTNENAATFVGWQWKAGGAAVTNTSGSITSQVSANQTAGFSVVTYTGTGSSGTVGHGLGVTPAMMIVKSRNATQYWIVQHQSLSAITYNMYLQATDTPQNDGQFTAKSSTTVTVSGGSVTGSGTNYVMYCWSEVAGYSKFGSYTGNNSNDGPFVYLGFKPKFVMIKSTDAVSYGHWVMKDSSRSTYNPATRNLYANFAYGEDVETTEYIDLLSNGFKIRGTVDGINGSNNNYIFVAFAENPFKYASAR